MKKTTKTILKVMMLTMALSVTACSEQKQNSADIANIKTESSTTKEAQQAQDTKENKFTEFKSIDLDGNEVTSDMLKQKDYTLVNFWGTFCQPCIAEMPDLGKIAEDYRDKDVQIVGIVIDTLGKDGYDESQVEKAREIIEKTGANYTHVQLSESMFEFLTDMNVQAIPRTMVVDKELNILEDLQGSVNEEYFLSMIESAKSKASENK